MNQSSLSQQTLVIFVANLFRHYLHGERSIAMSMSVSASVCLSFHEHISGTTCPIFTKFLCMLDIAVARSSSTGSAIRYGPPVYG